jgi:hypothetical protein
VRAVAGSEWAATGGTFPAVFAGCRSSSECSDPDKAIDWSGSDGNSIIGGVHSNCGISVSGSNNEVVGDTGYSSNNGCGFSNGGSGNSYETTPASAPNQTFPVNYTFSDFTCTVTRSGKLELRNHYLPGTTTVTPGTYCATGSSAEIDLSDGNVTANVTLVVYRGADGCGSGGKAISIGGSGFDLDAYDPTRVLMWTNVGDAEVAVKISGSNGTWSGLIVAPCGQVEISGQSVGTSGGGSILANRVKIAGSNVVIDSNGLSAFGPPTLLSLRLLE